MKKFENPEIEVKTIDFLDIITASGVCEDDGWGCNPDDSCPNNTGWG